MEEHKPKKTVKNAETEAFDNKIANETGKSEKVEEASEKTVKKATQSSIREDSPESEILVSVEENNQNQRNEGTSDVQKTHEEEGSSPTQAHEELQPAEDHKSQHNEDVQEDIPDEIPEINIPDYTDSEPSERINYSLLNREDLYKTLDELINSKNVNDIRYDVEIIKITFYKKLKSENEQRRKAFIDEGGNPEDFVPVQDPYEERIKDLVKKYRDLRTEHNKVHDDEKLENLKKKYEIIDEIKELVNREESINKTFHDFRELQNHWRDIGVVPQQFLNDLWETYHHHVEKFYDYIKINKELRDLDLKKNMELKIQLCEKAESLILEPNVINAFSILQKYHEQWREIGPVPKDKRSEIWKRFKEATAKINKNHQQHYQDLKESQKKNLESKTVLCEKVEKINSETLDQHKDWVKATNDILELQKVWKTIGFAPKKENNRIYARFRSACDLFFERKREFYAHTLEEQSNNLQMKLDLCVQAETLMNNTDWKKTSEEFIKLQKKWKQVGPVPRKQSDSVWRRFRSACDSFFQKKAEFFSKIDNTYESNLKSKEDLITEIQKLPKIENVDQYLKVLQEFQRRWAEIGFVPFNKKEEIHDRFLEAINKHYDSLDMDDFRKSILKFRNRVESILQKPKPEVKLRFEREKYMNKLQQLRNDIGIWENNIGFFSNTKNAASMIKGFEEKIQEAKKTITALEEKITIIDELDLDV